MTPPHSTFQMESAKSLFNVSEMKSAFNGASVSNRVFDEIVKKTVRRTRSKAGQETPDGHQVSSVETYTAKLFDNDFFVRMDIDPSSRSVPEGKQTVGVSDILYPDVYRRDEGIPNQAGKSVTVTTRRSIENTVPDTVEITRELGNMIHAWFGLYFSAIDKGRTGPDLDKFCELWNKTAGDAPVWDDAAQYLPAMTKGLQAFIETRVQEGEKAVFRTEVPLVIKETNSDGVRFSERRLDLLVEVVKEDKIVRRIIIDHKCTEVTMAENEEELTEKIGKKYGQQMGEYLRAVQTSGCGCECWIHLPLQGEFFRFEL